jgi:alpha-soluble NSF attachment protein
MSATKREEEGRAQMAAAEKKSETKSSFFKSMLGMSSGKEEEAGELFVKAANSFKLAKSWDLAGSAFTRAAQTFEVSSDLSYEAASKYSDAGKAYKNVSNSKAIGAYGNAIRLYTEAARFQQCARLTKEVAEMHEADKNFPAALESFGAAADFYDGEDAKSNANSMRVKVALLSASAGDFAKAAELFERIAADALESNLLKYSAREHLLRAGLCRLCIGDAIGASRAVESYGSMDGTFPTSREGQLLQAVASSVDDGDVDAFTNAVYDYDSLSKLDDWKTGVLLKIKKTIKEAEDGEEDLC